MLKYLIILSLSCSSRASRVDAQNLYDSQTIDSISTDSIISDSSIDSSINHIVPDASCACPTVNLMCGLYPSIGLIPTTNDAPIGEVCITAQNYTILTNWESGNNSWRICAYKY